MANDHLPQRNEILAKWADGTLADALFNEYERIWLDENNPTVNLLAQMHNAGEIDLLAIITTEAIEQNRTNFFNGQHLYERLIPRISSSVREMVRVVEAFRVGGGDDLAAGMHINKFAKWCSDDPVRPYDLLALIDEGVPDADGYLIIAIKTGTAVDHDLFIKRAYGFLENGTEQQRLNALKALGQIKMPDDAEWDRLLTALAAAQAANDDDMFRGQLLSAIASRLNDAPTDRVTALETMAMTAVAEGGGQTLHTAARILAFEAGPVSEVLEQRLLRALRGVASANGATLDLLDIALSQLIKSGKAAAVREFVHELVTRDENAVQLGKLDSTVRAVLDDTGTALADWVVDWLLDGDDRLCSAMDRAMLDAGRNEPTLRIDFSRFGLRDDDYPYLARKVVGSFFLKPLVMTSLLASLIRSAPAGSAEKIEGVLVDPVLKSYAGSTRDYLSPIADDESDPAAPAVKRALAAQDDYLKGLTSPGRVPELHPSERARQLEWERHNDSVTDAMRKARKKSIIAQIATESVILYGRRAVSWIDRPGDKPRRTEMELNSISTSFEVPRIDIVDPIGLQMLLLSFIEEKRPL